MTIFNDPWHAFSPASSHVSLGCQPSRVTFAQAEMLGHLLLAGALMIPMLIGAGHDQQRVGATGPSILRSGLAAQTSQ